MVNLTSPMGRLKSDMLGCKHCDSTGVVAVRSGREEYNTDVCPECFGDRDDTNDNYNNEIGAQDREEDKYAD